MKSETVEHVRRWEVVAAVVVSVFGAALFLHHQSAQRSAPAVKVARAIAQIDTTGSNVDTLRAQVDTLRQETFQLREQVQRIDSLIGEGK